MRQLSAQDLANELKIAAQISARLLTHPLGEFREELSRLGAFLQACETRLIKLMNGEHPSETEPGVTQYGGVLYVFDTTHPVLAKLLGFPKSQITPQLLLKWEGEISTGGGVDDYEGSLIAVGKYEQLDAGWVTALIYYLALKIGVREVSSWAPFGSTPAIITAQDDPVKIALIGDWGTGTWTDGQIDCPAIAVMNQVKALNPDYTIHLGDVYYAGTAGFVSDEEVDNFVKLWVGGSQGSFMLNSNHEMYSGAQGFFGQGLKAAPFAAQNNTSYFAIQGDKWVMLGLDTAYYDKSPLFMNGALTDTDQINFIRSLDTDGKTVIVLTHHNPTNIEGTATGQLTLWNDMTLALGRLPDYWYWGHIHNAIVYSDQSFPAQNGVKARCAGHGAIPFGIGYGLQNADGTNKPSIEYFANELLSSAYPNTDARQANRVLNGFAMLTVSADSIKEEFIDQTGVVRWTKTTPYKSFDVLDAGVGGGSV
jgi:Calcineurin-like phosphoesterase